MPFAPLASVLPDLAARETRALYTTNDDGTRGEGFAFTEMFCDEPRCDCRRVVFQVLSADDPDVLLATLTYGWEPESFYRKWAGFPLGDDDIEELKGPAFMRFAPQSPEAERMLVHLRQLLADPGYVERVVRHYRLFREAVDAKALVKPRSVISGWRSSSRKRRSRR
ncbi:MAG: hypothetical protein HYV09_10740 [Deltaproteobacteria bacterium]|nr:hypothetical protein [Deltaproteobacteria bacterium]